jgi:hypothetical protein
MPIEEPPKEEESGPISSSILNYSGGGGRRKARMGAIKFDPSQIEEMGGSLDGEFPAKSVKEVCSNNDTHSGRSSSSSSSSSSPYHFHHHHRILIGYVLFLHHVYYSFCKKPTAALVLQVFTSTHHQ